MTMHLQTDTQPTIPAPGPLPLLARMTTELRDELRRMEHRMGRDAPMVTRNDARRLFSRIEQWKRLMNEVLGDDSLFGEVQRDEIGRWIASQVRSFFVRSRIGGRGYYKPAGFAGDYETILAIYDQQPAGTDRLGKLLDAAALRFQGAKAVFNRRTLLADEIRRTAASVSPGTARVLSMACGPAQELLDVFDANGGGGRVQATLVDMDPNALDYVRARLKALGADHRAKTVLCNLIHTALGAVDVEVGPQDLIYSAGLIDYFDDTLVVALMDLAHGWLAPGGRVILGNFHPRNPDRAFLDHVLDWKLIHRTEADMNRLYRASRFGRGCTGVRFEAQGVNLFAECMK